MKQSFLKRTLIVALLVCMATLFTAVSPAGDAHAATTRAVNPAISCPGISISLGHVWHTGNSNTWTACSGKQLTLIYQTDGNFVLDCDGYGVIWNTETGGHPSQADYTSFQTDGNLVYGYNLLGWVGVDWASNTNGQGATHLQLQGDANVVIYTGSGKALWATGTNGEC